MEKIELFTLSASGCDVPGYRRNLLCNRKAIAVECIASTELRFMLRCCRKQIAATAK
jgi:hypothetical protein